MKIIRQSLFSLCTFLFALGAFAQSPNMVISQVYGGGGNAGASRTNDYVELFNRGNVAVNVAGWSVQYAATAGTNWTATPLTGTVPAGGYLLVQMASGGANGAAMPTPDVIGTINMAAGAGKVALLNVATAITAGTACPSGATVVDVVGYGPGTTTCNETAPTSPNLSATLAAFRAANGCTDTNSNAADFANATPAPRNSASPTNSCSVLPNLSINSVSIAEGNSGTSTLTFTVSLSAPAGAGGVTFDIATANGTATAGSDYVARALTAQTIAQGSSSYTFDVTIDGDTSPELDETFSVAVSNAVGANITTGTGTGTIQNDDAAPNLSINDVSTAEGNSGTTTFSFTVSLSAPAPAGGVTFDIATANGTATAGSDYTAATLTAQTIAAGSSTYTFNVNVTGDTVGEQNETFFVNVTNVVNAIPLDAQGLGTIVNDDVTPINIVQGTGNQSPLAGTTVTVEGTVTANFQGTNQLKGFYIQEPDATADADPATSEGIFVFTDATPYAVSTGDRVRVTGTVIEFGTAPNTLTEITAPTITTVSNGNPLPVSIAVTLPVAAAGELERYEGMLVTFTQPLTVSDHGNLQRFGELTLKANGRALQPTNEIDLNDNPASGTTSSGNSNGAAITAFADLNARSSIILDDASTVTNPNPIPFVDPATNTVRLGSTVANLSGVLTQAFGSHRVLATAAPAFTYAARPAAPVVGGNVKVAAANVLNYFNGDGAGAGFPTARGANTPLEFTRQRAKTIAALNGLGADVIALIEMENDGTGAQSAVQDLVNGLNAAAGTGTWAIASDPTNYAAVPGGTDAIRPSFIYKPAVVAPVGSATTISDPAFVIARAPVAQTFRLVANNEQFVVIANHFKAKSSGGATGLDVDQNDGQASFNNTRKLQATALLGFVNALAATTPRVITVGDFNAYSEEDPIDVLRAGGLTNIITGSYSYMFSGLTGSLDHALGNAALVATVSGSGKWHINADEPEFLDYNVEGKATAGCTSSCVSPDLYTATPFRASDHDPLIVGLNLLASQTITFPAIASFSWSSGSATLTATASSSLPVTYSVTSGPCAISGTTVTATSAGTCAIAANQAGNANYNAAPQVTQNVTVTATAQTITFPAIASFTWLGGSATLAATASSVLPVAYSLVTGPCVVSGATVTALSAGSCEIAANQSGDANYTPAAQVTQTVTVTAAAQTITFPAVAGFVWNSGTATLTALSSSPLPVSYAVTTGPCTLAGVTLTATGAGTCSVTASQAGNANYTAATPVSINVTALPAPQTITFGALANRTFGDAPFAVSATGGASTAPVTFSSSTPAVCTVAANTVTLIAAGTCSITANQVADTNYAAAVPVTQTFTVARAPQTITGFAPQSPVVYAPNGTFTLTATGGASGLPVTFSSSTPTVCTTGGNNGNTVNILSAGTCTLAASQAGNAGYSAATPVTAIVAIDRAPQTILFGTIPNAVFSGPSTLPQRATAGVTSGLAVTFTALTPTVCGNPQLVPTITTGIPLPNNPRTVDIPLLAAGICTIRVAQGGDTNYLPAQSVDQSFTVAAAPSTGLTIVSSPGSIVEGQPYQVVFTVSGNNPTGTITWATTPATTLPAGCSPLTLVNGRAAIPSNCLPATLRGGQTLAITANYSGDANNFASTSTISLTAAAVLREVTLAADIINPRANAPVLLTALVRGVVPNGTVTFAVNGAPLQGCTNVAISYLASDANAAVATCRTTALAGAVQYTASYANDANNVIGPVSITSNSPNLGPLDYGDMWWAGAQENGWGLHIAQKGLQQFNTFYVHDASGKPVWYAMSGGAWNADFTRFTGDIYQPTGSVFTAYDATQWKPGTPVGRGTLTFTDANNGVFDFTIAGVTGRKTITRFLFAPADANPRVTVKDIWWGTERENGWGVAIAQQSSGLFAAWYTYGADGKTTWYVMLNGGWNGTTYIGQLYTSTSSPWLTLPYNPQLFRSQLVGAVQFDFRDQNTANMTYTVNGVTQTKLITRLPF
jgi:predicted extracellular nuclease